ESRNTKHRPFARTAPFLRQCPADLTTCGFGHCSRSAVFAGECTRELFEEVVAHDSPSSACTPRSFFLAFISLALTVPSRTSRIAETSREFLSSTSQSTKATRCSIDSLSRQLVNTAAICFRATLFSGQSAPEECPGA